ncbi:MAG: complex I NDUFA9 subunit family protein [Rhodospirillaceae bacterium]
MADKLVTIFGGSGFIGSHLVRHLAAQGWRIRIGVRDIRKGLFLKPSGDLGQISFLPVSVTDPGSVATAVAGADAVVNLVGILYESKKRTFAAIHEKGAENVARAAMAAGVRRLVHISALGADATSPSAYARSKAAGERAVAAAFPSATIMRPSVVFGAEDGFFNRFGAMAQKLPVLPFFTDTNPHLPGGGGSKFQPVYVGDVVGAIGAAVNDPRHLGKTYELVGPRVYDMREIMQIVNRETMRRRPIIGLPYLAGDIPARVFNGLRTVAEKIPPVSLGAPFLTPDQIVLLRLGNVGAGQLPGLEAFGIAPTAAEVIVPTYLKRFRPIQQTKRLRLQPRNS